MYSYAASGPFSRYLVYSCDIVIHLSFLTTTDSDDDSQAFDSLYARFHKQYYAERLLQTYPTGTQRRIWLRRLAIDLTLDYGILPPTNIVKVSINEHSPPSVSAWGFGLFFEGFCSCCCTPVSVKRHRTHHSPDRMKVSIKLLSFLRYHLLITHRHLIVKC